jgi:23S rRNA pseudouridine2605 synthase
MGLRLNKFIANTNGYSRRWVDKQIALGKVTINDQIAKLGEIVEPSDVIKLDGQVISHQSKTITVMLNKPLGYVCSRRGQGSPTIYQLLPRRFHQLKPVGRLDKDSSGLLLLTNDGKLAYQLTHPKYVKSKIYEIYLDHALSSSDAKKIDRGIKLTDGLSQLSLKPLSPDRQHWQVTIHEGRNRQIRRTFQAINYRVTRLHRRQIADYQLGNLASGQIKEV